jgi:hypothetical protein
MLVLLREIVILTVSSFKASSSGEGRKSEMTLTFPMGSSVYFILAVIYFLSFPPVSGADEANDAMRPMSVAQEEDAGADFAQQPPAEFAGVAVQLMKKNRGLWISEGLLRGREIHPPCGQGSPAPWRNPKRSAWSSTFIRLLEAISDIK